MDNFLSAESLLINRLKTKLGSDILTRVAVSLDWAIINALAPSVNVIFLDDVVDEEKGGNASFGRSQSSYQYFLIVLTLRDVSDAGNAGLQKSGVWLLEILKSLQGYVLSEEHRPLYRKKCQYRKTHRDGYVHYPFLFSTGVTVTGYKEIP